MLEIEYSPLAMKARESIRKTPLGRSRVKTLEDKLRKESIAALRKKNLYSIPYRTKVTVLVYAYDIQIKSPTRSRTLIYVESIYFLLDDS